MVDFPRQIHPELIHEVVADLVRFGLGEDGADDDVTTRLLIDPKTLGAGRLLAKQEGVLAGLPTASEVFHQLDQGLGFHTELRDGTKLEVGQTIATVEGCLASILAGERLALNLLQRLSGIATMTSQFVAAVDGTQTRILDTRKTVPGLRLLEKYAVKAGGGYNHRLGLADAILIKDNHIAAMRRQGLSLDAIVGQARAKAPPGMIVEIEVTNADEANEAADGKPDLILLDNMTPDQMKASVNAVGGRAMTEASGGITLQTIGEVAKTGVDFISVGALTHSAPALDMSLSIQP